MDYTKKYIKYKKKYFDLKQELEGGGNKNKALAAVKQDGLALKYVAKELRSDKEVVFAAIQEDGSALEFASKELRGDSDVVSTAVKNDNSADNSVLNFASKECILYIIQNKYDDLSDCLEDCILLNLSPKLKKYRDITLAAILISDIELAYALPKFRNDKKFILTIAEKNKLNLEYVSKKLRDDEEIVLAAIKQDAIINNVYAFGPAVFLTFASSRLQRDKTFLMKCYRANKKTKYFSNIIKNFDKMSKYF